MTASVRLENNRLMVSGDLNFVTVPELSAQSLPLLMECNALQFDLSRVTSSNSAGLALLLEWLKHAKKRMRYELNLNLLYSYKKNFLHQ